MSRPTHLMTETLAITRTDLLQGGEIIDSRPNQVKINTGKYPHTGAQPWQQRGTKKGAALQLPFRYLVRRRDAIRKPK